MDSINNEKPPMAHPQEPKPDTVDNRPPMAHQKPGLSRRIQTGLARLGLITTIAAGGAGVVHHVNPDIELGGPVPIGAAVDNIGTAAVDKLVELSKTPTPDVQGIEYQREAAEAFFKVNGFQAGGQIEIDLAGLSEARTKEMQLTRMLGGDAGKFDVSTIKSIKISDKEFPAEPGLRIAIDNPVVVNRIGEGLGKYFLVDVETETGTQILNLSDEAVYTITPGIFEPLSAVTQETMLDVARKVSPKE